MNAVSRPLLLVAALGGPLFAQEGYRLPPADVVAIAEAAPAPYAMISPDGAWMVLAEQDAMPGIADVARPWLGLAGMRIDPAAESRWRSNFIHALTLRDLKGERERRIPLPKGARVSWTSWSHRSNLFAFALLSEEGSELWCVSIERPEQPRRLTDRLSTVMGAPTWMPDGRQLLCRLVPEDRGDPPLPATTPAGPNVQETSGRTTPLRTYQDLLSSEEDSRLFEYYTSTSVAIVDGFEGSLEALDLEVGIYPELTPSPDGQWLLLTCVHRPFSFLMPWTRFPHHVFAVPIGPEADQDGRETVLIAEVPLVEDVPIEGVRTGPRNADWKPSEAATLFWAEALDGGDPEREVDHRDRWMRLDVSAAQAAPEEVLRTEERAIGLSWFPQPNLVLTSDYDRDRRWIRAVLHDLEGELEPRVIEDRSVRDRYGDPGRIVRRYTENGGWVARVDDGHLWRTGRGASPEGNLPFLDRQNLATLETTRVWRCEKGAYESVRGVYGGDSPWFVTQHETPEQPLNLRQRRAGSESFTALTDFPDPTPQIRGIKKQLVKYEREDGVPLSGTLYLPADYEEGQRLPLFVWAYPVEYNDPSTAGQISSSPWTFTRFWGPSQLYLLTQGWAVLDGATMPVVGDPETMNDTFIEQIVAAAQAAIDKVADMGIADPDRVAVGGHSYGAFMTANLLAHCDLFRAGVARSGAYNRTLTPFGFQSERRTLWESPETYFTVSPFMHADKIDEPLLIVHGEKDNNSGTFPIQSERLFQAIKGHGGTARLVMLPAESHGYRARESVLHVLAESLDWLDEHVASAGPRAIEAASGGPR